MRLIDADKLRESLHETLMQAHNRKSDCYEDDFSLLFECIDEQPTVNNWIPCSKQLPKPKTDHCWVECIVSVIRGHYPTSTYDICDAPYEEEFVTFAKYDTLQKIWHLDFDEQLNALLDVEELPLNGDYVIAWQPLPEPYKGE